MYLGAGSFIYLLVISRMYDLVRLVSRFKRGTYGLVFLGFSFNSSRTEITLTDGFYFFLNLFLLTFLYSSSAASRSIKLTDLPNNSFKKLSANDWHISSIWSTDNSRKNALSTCVRNLACD